MSRSDHKETLFIGNLSPDITETDLKTCFSAYGKVSYAVIPKYSNTGKPKTYGFVIFTTEEEAVKTYEQCRLGTPRVRDMPLIVSWAYGSKGHSPRRHSRYSVSRSRSPRRHSSKQESLIWKIEDLRKERYSLSENINKLEKKIKDYRTDNEKIRKEIDSIKSQVKIFLPCAHTKKISVDNKNELNELYSSGISMLSPEERMNEILVRQLKSRVFYILEAKYPDVYKCKELVKMRLGDCEHTRELECWQKRDFLKTSGGPVCGEKLEKTWPCGHKELLVCSLFNLEVCKACSYASSL